jgi:hypothetical protein
MMDVDVGGKIVVIVLLGEEGCTQSRINRGRASGSSVWHSTKWLVKMKHDVGDFV